MNEANAAILAISEQLMSSADMSYRKQMYKRSGKIYDLALTALRPLQGSSNQEMMTLQIYANQMSLLIKQEQYVKALTLLKAAVALPSFPFDEPTKKRLLQLETIAKLKIELKKDPTGQTISHPDNDDYYSDVYPSDGLRVTEHAAGLSPLTEEDVDIIIDSILECQASPPVVESIFLDLQKRSELDLHNSVGHNILWALCQAAIMRADMNDHPDDYIFTPLEYLIRRGCRAEQRFGITEPTSSSLSLQINPGRTPLQMLALAGATRCVDYLISEGAQVESYDIDGWTPLLVACATNGINLKSKNNSDMVMLLIDNGANVNHANVNGLTPLMAAAYSLDHESVGILLRYGAHLKKCSVNGFSPLMWALLGTSLSVQNNHVLPGGNGHDYFPSSSSVAGSVHTSMTGFISNQTTITAHHSYHSESTMSKDREEQDLKKRQLCVQKLLGVAKRGRDVKLLSSMEEDMKCFKIAKLLVYLRHVWNSLVQEYIDREGLKGEVEENMSLASFSTRTMPEDLFGKLNEVLSKLILGSAGGEVMGHSSSSIDGDRDTIITDIDRSYIDEVGTFSVMDEIGDNDADDESLKSYFMNTEKEGENGKGEANEDTMDEKLRSPLSIDTDPVQAPSVNTDPTQAPPEQASPDDNHNNISEKYEVIGGIENDIAGENHAKLYPDSSSHASIKTDNISQLEKMYFRRGVVQSIKDSLPAIVVKRWFPVNTGTEIDPSQALASASYEDRMKLYALTTLCHGENSDRPLLVLRRVSEDRQYLLEEEVDVTKVKREYKKLDVVWVSSAIEDLEQLIYTPLRSTSRSSVYISI